MRATPTKRSQNPLLPASANLLVPSCTARTAIADVITAAACIAISTAVALFPLRDCVACTCRLQFCVCLSCLSPAAVRRFPYVVRSVSPPLVSCSTEPVRIELLPAAQDQARLSLVPRSRSPLSPPPCSHTTHPLPGREGAATSKAVIDESTACIATNHCMPLFPVVSVDPGSSFNGLGRIAREGDGKTQGGGGVGGGVGFGGGVVGGGVGFGMLQWCFSNTSHIYMT